ncbi:helix-turn-helix domain-containing protein [Paenibacillus sp.]|uniref:helix-turn-helix domain-containing protein n=1 Tax=Paenibacillus sp. TaxID=58172 RepID=UPI002D285E06|nr:helix-turn-helix domain-containing protein [Paenibacillus sp.]HZG84033.1 helix-turn-helix domain-containing protein [Paenibacillus sp.]
MKLLVVDDEILAVEGVIASVDWNQLGVHQLFKAFNVRQAKEIFEKESIDIMLCDIEMPQESGIELIQWVKGNQLQTETIFLTCHADFQYAKQAIQHGSLDYLLKPIEPEELTLAIAKAIEKIGTTMQMKQYSQYGEYWVRHQPVVVEQFWLDILKRKIPSVPEAIAKIAAERNIPYAGKMKLLPLLLKVQRWYKTIGQRDEKILEFALQNTAEEIFQKAELTAQIIPLDRGELVVVLSSPEQYVDLPSRLKSVLEAYISACNRYFYCDIACYIGKESYIRDLASMKDRLQQADRDNVSRFNAVIRLEEGKCIRSIALPDMKLWSVLLEAGENARLLREAVQYLRELVSKDQMNAVRLQQFHHNFLQMVYSYLQQQGIHAHELFMDSTSLSLNESATKSVPDMMKWIEHLLSRAAEYGESHSLFEKVKRYIHQHIDQEMSREEIANHVYLNPDYLTRVFKKETGMSISEFVLSERLKVAKELLAKTDLSVSSVALRVGHHNFSYFSKLFRKHTGLTPVEYKNRYITDEKKVN